MTIPVTSPGAAALLTILLATTLGAQAGAPAMPPMKKQPTPQAVVDEHLDAINKCDWNRLMAQYPNDVEIHLTGLICGNCGSA